jgi:hypothetical protein
MVTSLLLGAFVVGLSLNLLKRVSFIEVFRYLVALDEYRRW